MNSCFKRSDNEENIKKMNDILKDSNREINLIGYYGGGDGYIGSLPPPNAPVETRVPILIPIEKIPYYNTIIICYANFGGDSTNPTITVRGQYTVSGQYYTGFTYPRDNTTIPWLKQFSENIKKWKEVEKKSYKGPERKVLITLGGAGDHRPQDYFKGNPSISGTYGHTLTQIKENEKSLLINFLDEFNLDGIDFDYERPNNMSGNADDNKNTGVKYNWRHFVRHLKHNGKIVTAAPFGSFSYKPEIMNQYLYLLNYEYMGAAKESEETKKQYTIDIMLHQMYNSGVDFNRNSEWYNYLKGVKDSLSTNYGVKLNKFGSIFQIYPFDGPGTWNRRRGSTNCWNVVNYIHQIIDQINNNDNDDGNFVTNHGVFQIEYDYFYGYYFARLINSLRDHSNIFIAKDIKPITKDANAGKVVKTLTPDLFNQLLYMYNSIIDKTNLKKIPELQNIQLPNKVSLNLNITDSTSIIKDFNYVNYTSRVKTNNKLAYDEIVLSEYEIKNTSDKGQYILQIQSGRVNNLDNFINLEYSYFDENKKFTEMSGNYILISSIGEGQWFGKSDTVGVDTAGTDSYMRLKYYPSKYINYNNIESIIIESELAATMPKKLNLINSEIIAPICFIKDTPVKTDQGEIKIQEINTDIHTINSKKILAITKTKLDGHLLVRVEKHALGEGCPNHSVVMSGNHKILYNNELIMAKDLALNMPGKLKYMKYMGDTLYNVLMKDYDTMVVNNMTVETLHPDNEVSLLYRRSLKESSK